MNTSLLLAASGGGDAHLILLIIFIVVMLMWLLAGVDWAGPEPAYRRLGGGLLPWIAVAILGYLMFG